MEQGIIAKLKKHHLILILAFAVSLLVLVIVYLTGGTSKVYSHLMYAPIAVVSSVYGKKAGLFHAIISGFLLGPFMPLNVGEQIAQEPVNWITRIILFAGISLIIGFFSDYDQKHKERINNLLTHDMITGLKNLEAIKREDNRISKDCTFIVLSVKNFDDTMSFWGYNFSNAIVEEFAKRLDKALYSFPDVELYRYAGMQFIVKITQNPDHDIVSEIIGKISELNKSILTAESIPVYVEIHMGIAAISGESPMLDGLRQAFIAHNYAQANEIYTYYFDTGLESHYRNILDVASSFSTGLASHRIEAAYQQVYFTQSEKISGVEMLARWTKEDNTRISPEFFIPIIEKTDLIRELTKYMITRAVQYVVYNKDNDRVASINFSQKDFCDDSLTYLFKSIEAAGIDPGRIAVEVTERSLVDIENMIKYLKRLRDYRIQIAIDDFGAGYSSYQYVSELPIDMIKIDKSIIMQIEKNATSRSLAKSIVDFSRENHILTLAEGVETREIVDICKDIGVDYLQGYFFHRPEIMM